MTERQIAAVGVAAAAAAGIFLYLKQRSSSGKPAVAAKLALYQTANDSDSRAWLSVLSKAADEPLDSAAFAAAIDAAEPLRGMRGEFHIPPVDGGGEEQAYLAGNSLGLLPKATEAGVKAELDKWAARGVMGHFEGALPWATCEDAIPPLVAELVGAKHPQLEVGAMNSLTVNLHLLMAAFYRPTDGRAAIIIEAGAFPSDRYAVGSQIRHHGRDPNDWLIEVAPRADGLLHTEDSTMASGLDPIAHTSDQQQHITLPACCRRALATPCRCSLRVVAHLRLAFGSLAARSLAAHSFAAV